MIGVNDDEDFYSGGDDSDEARVMDYCGLLFGLRRVKFTLILSGFSYISQVDQVVGFFQA